MIDSDARLFNRLRDLQSSLGEDLDWLVTNPRSDGLHDLGERLSELGADLIRRADDLNGAVLATLPEGRWIPEAGTRIGKIRNAHYLGERPLRCGLVYLAACGAACYPFYGRDTARRIARHPPCETCQRWAESPGKERDA